MQSWRRPHGVAPSVCALINCSVGISATLNARSRVMKGAIPMMISTTLEASPSPNAVNRIGKSAKGGIIDSTAMEGDSRTRS